VKHSHEYKSQKVDPMLSIDYLTVYIAERFTLERITVIVSAVMTMRESMKDRTFD
jgi:hypothetical protein